MIVRWSRPENTILGLFQRGMHTSEEHSTAGDAHHAVRMHCYGKSR